MREWSANVRVRPKKNLWEINFRKKTTWREIFNDLISLQKEIYTSTLAGEDFDEDFRPGFIRELFVKRDPRLVITIFKAISERLDSPEFKYQVPALYRSCLERQARDMRHNFPGENRSSGTMENLKKLDERISSASWEKFSEYCANFFVAYSSLPRDNYFRNNYLLFSIADLLFEHLLHHDGSRFIVPRDSLLASEYANAKINLFESDAQFNAYGLLTVIDEIEFSEIKPLEPFDKRVNKHLTLDADDPTVLELIALRKRRQYWHAILSSQIQHRTSQ